MDRRRSTNWPTLGTPALAIAALVTVLAACSEGSPLFEGGRGSSESVPFELRDGAHLLAWTTSAQTPSGCQISVELVSADGVESVARAEGGTASGGAAQEAEPVPKVTAGSYRLRVETTCESWSAVVGEDTALRD